MLTTPVIRCLYKQTNAEIHFLVKRAFAGVLSANPYIHQLHLFDQDLASVVQQLGAIAFDHIIDLQKNVRSLRVRRALKVPYSSFHKQNLAKWLMVNFKINRLPKKHIVDRYLASTQGFKIHNDGEGLDVFYQQQQMPIPTTKFLVLAIGGAHYTKRLPTQQLIKICSSLRHKVVLLGGPSDEEEAQKIESSCPEVHNLVGKIDLQGSMQVIEHAHLVISHDTGMMHIAAALKKPIISIWGNTIPSFGMYPYYGDAHNVSHYMFEVPNLKCRPCSKIGFSQCPKGHFQCMQHQDIEGIVQTVQKIMASAME